EKSRLTPELFARAAARAGLSSRIVKRPLGKISPLVMPAVLLLRDGNACVLVGRSPGGMLRVIQPESGEGECELAEQELEASYTGYAIFVRPAFRFDARAQAETRQRADHWLWSALKQSWPIYAE